MISAVPTTASFVLCDVSGVSWSAAEHIYSCLVYASRVSYPYMVEFVTCVVIAAPSSRSARGHVSYT